MSFVLLERAAIGPHHRVLEIGCGTGALLLRLKHAYPGADVVGLDPDPKALDRARRKARRAGVSIALDRGFSDELPYPAASFDRALSSFMFHHLEMGDKERTLVEVHRVLKPGGAFHLLDFAGPESESGGVLLRRLHSSPRLDDNAEDRVLDFMRRAGFTDARRTANGTMFFGHIRLKYYAASSEGREGRPS